MRHPPPYCLIFPITHSHLFTLTHPSYPPVHYNRDTSMLNRHPSCSLTSFTHAPRHPSPSLSVIHSFILLWIFLLHLSLPFTHLSHSFILSQDSSPSLTHPSHSPMLPITYTLSPSISCYSPLPLFLSLFFLLHFPCLPFPPSPLSFTFHLLTSLSHKRVFSIETLTRDISHPPEQIHSPHKRKLLVGRTQQVIL